MPRQHTGPTGILQDRRREIAALGELPVVPQELLDPLYRLDLDADARDRPSAAKPVLVEGPKDPIVDVLHIRMGFHSG